ncbi:unnamed protein product [Chondrus crispus]|uniref:Uncharacterized protein n=1 Tax=Chondrus crispus TaxID=2769 RepID=R7QR18_CHOCR|nr:unnamed protein product [Chondrus crispus]CDF39921.1 unnamed protein product [Chondrus crispus]|eukprot:XP_005710215.1 unnamed protein product [Chondrus crispus]
MEVGAKEAGAGLRDERCRYEGAWAGTWRFVRHPQCQVAHLQTFCDFLRYFRNGAEYAPYIRQTHIFGPPATELQIPGDMRVTRVDATHSAKSRQFLCCSSLCRLLCESRQPQAFCFTRSAKIRNVRLANRLTPTAHPLRTTESSSAGLARTSLMAISTTSPRIRCASSDTPDTLATTPNVIIPCAHSCLSRPINLTKSAPPPPTNPCSRFVETIFPLALLCDPVSSSDELVMSKDSMLSQSSTFVHSYSFPFASFHHFPSSSVTTSPDLDGDDFLLRLRALFSSKSCP